MNWDWILRIVISIDTLIIMEYLNFRFHLAENYVLKKDYLDNIKAIFAKLDEIGRCQQKILLKLGEKADRGS
jgi:hypothetical protein